MKNILFVQDGFCQSGGERQLYEIIRFLKSHYSEEYTIRFLIYSAEYKEEYYYDKLVRLGVSIHFICSKRPDINRALKVIDKVFFWLLKKMPFVGLQRKNWRKQFHDVFVDVDLIVNNKIFLLLDIQKYIPKSIPVIHHAIIVSKQFSKMDRQEFSTPYTKLNIKKLFVTYPCLQMKHEIESQCACAVRKFYRIDLPASMVCHTPQVYTNTELRLAYVARIHHDKAFTVILPIVHELMTRGIPIKCYLVGRQDNPEFARVLRRTIGLLHIEKHIEMVNHLSKLASLSDYNIDIVLAGGVHDFIGYSSIDVIAAGFPVLLWDQGDLKSREKDSSCQVFPRSRSISDFCDKIEHYADSPGDRLELAQNQQKEVKKIHDAELIGEATRRCYDDVLAQ